MAMSGIYLEKRWAKEHNKSYYCHHLPTTIICSKPSAPELVQFVCHATWPLLQQHTSVSFWLTMQPIQITHTWGSYMHTHILPSPHWVQPGDAPTSPQARLPFFNGALPLIYRSWGMHHLLCSYWFLSTRHLTLSATDGKGTGLRWHKKEKGGAAVEAITHRQWLYITDTYTAENIPLKKQHFWDL